MYHYETATGRKVQVVYRSEDFIRGTISAPSGDLSEPHSSLHWNTRTGECLEYPGMAFMWIRRLPKEPKC